MLQIVECAPAIEAQRVLVLSSWRSVRYGSRGGRAISPNEQDPGRVEWVGTPPATADCEPPQRQRREGRSKEAEPLAGAARHGHLSRIARLQVVAAFFSFFKYTNQLRPILST